MKAIPDEEDQKSGLFRKEDLTKLEVIHGGKKKNNARSKKQERLLDIAGEIRNFALSENEIDAKKVLDLINRTRTSLIDVADENARKQKNKKKKT